jgi:NAD(P)-dependent dehydrogenase (short-subunit alcohol dehydrogenase family)
MDFTGSVALVTGASRGVGRALAAHLVRAGAQVVAAARSGDELEALAAEVGPTCLPFACDLTRSGDVARMAEFVRGKFGRLDVLVGNAAMMGPRASVADLQESDWLSVMDANVNANWRLIRAFDPLLRAAPAGRAVFMTSGNGSRARMAPGRGAYAISKAALDALVRSYASETEGSAVRVMLCNPGPLRTGMRALAAPQEDPSTLRTPDDFAPSALRLCSPQWTQTGMLYDYPQDRVLSFGAPG